MSGPVWRVCKGDGNDTIACDQCLKESTSVYAEGEVKDGEFHAQHHLCQQCYPEQISQFARRR